MTELHAKVDVVEGALPSALVGGGAGIDRRSFAVLTLMRDDGTLGLGEASPLPGYSPDDMWDVAEALHALVATPIEVDALASPFDIVSCALGERPPAEPSARFALETAVLDWLGRNRGLPVHRILGGDAERDPVPIGDLVMAQNPSEWLPEADRLLADGATHLKLKVGLDVAREVQALQAIRSEHRTLPLRLDGNGNLSVEELRAYADAFERLELEMFEEPVSGEAWSEVLELPLPWALDESLLDVDASLRALESERVRALVLKPTVLGGFGACFEWAGRAAVVGADVTVSHTFDGPIARAAAAELALALRCGLAAGLGPHPALELWPPCTTASIDGRRIVPHDEPGLGLTFEEEPDA